MGVGGKEGREATGFEGQGGVRVSSLVTFQQPSSILFSHRLSKESSNQSGNGGIYSGRACPRSGQFSRRSEGGRDEDGELASLSLS